MVKEKAQVVLEVCFIFTAIVLLLFGILGIWLWFNVDVADRAKAFNSTRLIAGRNPDFYVDHDAIILEDYFTSRPITEDWVFEGEFSEQEEIRDDYLDSGTSGRQWHSQPLPSWQIQGNDAKKMQKFEKVRTKIKKKIEENPEKYEKRLKKLEAKRNEMDDVIETEEPAEESPDEINDDVFIEE